MCVRVITQPQPRHHPLDAVVEDAVGNTTTVLPPPCLRVEVDLVPRRLPETLDLAAPPELFGVPVREDRHGHV